MDNLGGSVSGGCLGATTGSDGHFGGAAGVGGWRRGGVMVNLGEDAKTLGEKRYPIKTGNGVLNQRKGKCSGTCASRV